MRSIVRLKGRRSYPGWVTCPVTRDPAPNGPASFTPNHWPNWSASVSARHTRDRGVRSTTCFSMRSVLIVVICNLLIAFYRDGHSLCNHQVVFSGALLSLE